MVTPTLDGFYFFILIRNLGIVVTLYFQTAQILLSSRLTRRSALQLSIASIFFVLGTLMAGFSIKLDELALVGNPLGASNFNPPESLLLIENIVVTLAFWFQDGLLVRFSTLARETENVH